MAKETVKDRIAKIAGRAATNVSKVVAPYDGWPPPCMGLIHQPKRPQSIVNAAKQSKK